MIISHGRRFIFVHIPKTGGTSMALALEARAMADDILIGDTPKAVKRRGRLKDEQTAGRVWKHMRLADAEGLVTRDQMAAYLTFTLVRNPWDRMVSYYHWLQAQTFENPWVTLAKTVDFPAFLNDAGLQRSFALNPSAHYMRDGAGAEHCSHYVRIEHLATDLAPVEAHLGFALDVPKVNESRRQGDYRRYYTEDLARIVAEVAADDIARFDYRFDPA